MAKHGSMTSNSAQIRSILRSESFGNEMSSSVAAAEASSTGPALGRDAVGVEPICVLDVLKNSDGPEMSFTEDMRS